MKLDCLDFLSSRTFLNSQINERRYATGANLNFFLCVLSLKRYLFKCNFESSLDVKSLDQDYEATTSQSRTSENNFLNIAECVCM